MEKNKQTNLETVISFLKDDFKKTKQDFKELRKNPLEKIKNSKSIKNFSNLLISSVPTALGGIGGGKISSIFTNNLYAQTAFSISGGISSNFISLGILSYVTDVTKNLNETLNHVKNTFISSIPLTGEYIFLKSISQPYLVNKFNYSVEEASLISDLVITSINSAILTYSTLGYFGKRKNENK